MRTLIYKRTHSGDPAPEAGVFGNHDCMGKVRSWPFDAVIGIGGIGNEPEREGIAGKLTWIGIGARKIFDDPDRAFVTPERPLVKFDHFLYYGRNGRFLKDIAPSLVVRIQHFEPIQSRVCTREVI